MSVSGNFVNLQANLALPKAKGQKRDLTSFTGNSNLKARSNPVEGDSKEVRQIQNLQMRHNLSFQGRSTAKIIGSSEYWRGTCGCNLSNTMWSDHTLSNEIKNRELVNMEINAPSGSGTIVGIKRIYKPYCWEDVNTNKYMWEWPYKDIFPAYRREVSIDHDEPGRLSPDVIEPSFTREDSLYSQKQVMLRNSDSARDIAKSYKVKYSDLNNMTNSNGFIEMVLGSTKIERKWAREYFEEAEKAEKLAQDYENKAEWAEGEAKILKAEREKGELIDISVQNINNPNKPFEDFLIKAKSESHDLKWVDGKLMATPYETIKVADAVLLALGNDRLKITPLETPLKQLLVKGAMVEEKFVENVLRGLPKLLKR